MALFLSTAIIACVTQLCVSQESYYMLSNSFHNEIFFSHQLRHTTDEITTNKTYEVHLVGQYKTRTADYGLRTGYKTQTRYKMRTKHYGLGIKYGLRYKMQTEHYGLSGKHEGRSTLNKFSHERFYKWKLLISRKSPLIQV